MRRLIVTMVLVAVVAVAPACRTKRKVAHVTEDDGQLASVVNVADPRASIQLVRGFHAVESDQWRWTMKNFTVTLRPPSGAAQNGAKLELKFAIPDVIFDRVGAITLGARVNGVDLGPQTFTKAGADAYVRDVPASALQGDAATFDFSVNKSLPPSDKDARELAIIVTTVGLVLK